MMIVKKRSLLISCTLSFASGDTAVIWHNFADGEGCLGGKAENIADEGEGDYLRIFPNSWHNGYVKFGLTGCKVDGQRPDFGKYAALSFKAKALGFQPNIGCEPSLNLKGGPYPRFYSNTIILKDSYVQGGELVDYEYRQVVVPVSDLKTEDFPLLDQIQYLNFLKCSGVSGYSYHIQSLEMTNSPSSLESPLSSSTVAPTTDLPTESLTLMPTNHPTPYPTQGPQPDLELWSGLEDGYSLESNLQSCLIFNDRGITTQEAEVDSNPAHILVKPDSWRSGGLQFGCLAKESGICIHSCISGASRPDFSPYAALAFRAKLDNIAALETGCVPRVKLYGGGSSAAESKIAVLTGSYVDAGSLAPGEWRQVVIPVADLQNSWDLNGSKTLRFLTCGTDFSSQPEYRVTDVRLTDFPPIVISPAPTPLPTVRVTSSPSMATHVKYNRDWFPIIDISVGNWLVAYGSLWPELPAGANDHEYSIFIPAGSHVIYSEQMATKLDKVVIENGASLEISDHGTDEVYMTVSTLRVEEGGTLTISTAGSSSSIEIQFDGALDEVADPTELMNGLVSLGGTVLIQGRDRCSKMEEIAVASAGSSMLIVKGNKALECWGIGDELIFPDTQTGLEMGHWDFSQVYNPTVAQMESSKIVALGQSGVDTWIELEAPLLHSHLDGAHVAMVSRTIVLRTSDTSVSRGHILHTGYGSFDVKNSRIEDMGRTTVDPINSTVIFDSGVQLAEGLARMEVSSSGTNQIARYALHAHHSLVPMSFFGNVVIGGLRFGIVVHNSRVAVRDNIVIGVEGTGILLEDGTETGEVTNNFIIGTGGTGEGDGLRFTPSQGIDLGFGGFGIWSRTAYSCIEGNVAEGVFGEAPYAFFLHINFMGHREVPPVEGTPLELVGMTRSRVQWDIYDGALSLNTYGSFKDNSCLGSWVTAFSSSYFFGTTIVGGHILENFNAIALAKAGSGLSFGHSSTFTLSWGSVKAVEEGNSIVGVVCINGNLTITDTDFSYIDVSEQYGGCLLP